MKIKVPPRQAVPQGQTIIIKEKREGFFMRFLNFGCATIVLGGIIIGLFIVWGPHFSGDDDTPPISDERRAALAIEKPLIEIVQLNFTRALQEHLRDPDSYKPGEYRYHDHPRGYAYFHEYRATNGFGGYNQEICGLLCATNTGERVWTYYGNDQISALFAECGIK